MPFMHAKVGGSDGYGLQVVDSEDFSNIQQILDTSHVITQAKLVYGGTLGEDGPSDVRPYAVVYATGGKWYRLDLRKSASLTPIQISSESVVAPSSASVYCPTAVITTDPLAPQHSALLYQVPGPTGSCANEYARMIRLDDAPTQAPTVTSIWSTLVYPIYDKNSRYYGLLSKPGNDLRYYASDFMTSVEIASDVTRFAYAATRPNGESVVLINSDLRRIKTNGKLIGEPLRTLPSEYRFASSVNDGQELFWYEDNTDSKKRSFWRTAMDGSSAPVNMYKTKEYLNEVRGFDLFTGVLSEKNLIFSHTVLDPTTSELRYELYSMSKTAASGVPAPVLVDSQKYGTAFVDDKRVYYNHGAYGSQAAHVAKDNGTPQSDFGADTTFLAGPADGSYIYRLPPRRYTHLILAQGINAGVYPYAKAKVKMYRLVDGAKIPLKQLPPKATSFSAGYAIGSPFLGTMGIDGADEIFAAEADSGEYRTITNTKDISEVPIQ